MHEDTLRSIEAEIRARTGIDLGEHRRADLRRAVQRLASTPDSSHADALVEVVSSGPPSSLVAELVSAVTINETHFWRVPEQFEALRSEVFPALAVDRERPLRVWSAACSTGPEPYSAAMAADAAAVLRRPGVQIDATDVDPGALRLAREAKYGTWAMRGVDGPMRRRWFSTEPDGAVRPVARLRAAVDFSVHSVLDPCPFEPYDVILCRNVLIYFDAETRRRVVAHLFDALLPGGLLLVAPAEMQQDLFARFEPAVFRSGALGYRRPFTRSSSRRDGLSVPSPRGGQRGQQRRQHPPPRQSATSPTPVVTGTGTGTVRPQRVRTSQHGSAETVEARIRQGLGLIDQDEGQAALRILREVAVLAPESADAHAALALALLHERSFRRAGAAAKRALLLLGEQADTSEAGQHAVVVLGTLAALEVDG